MCGIMRKSSLVSCLGILCGIAQVGSAQAQQAPVDPPSARILNISANGSGCPAGTWTAELGDDGLTAQLKFTGFEAAVGANRSFDTKNCQLGLELSNTEEYSYAIESVTFQGAATLQAGVLAELTTQAYISGSPGESTTSSSDIDAPFDGFFGTAIVLGDATDDSLTWTSCGPAYDLNFNTRIILRNAPSVSTPSLVDLDGLEAGISLSLIKRDC